MCTLRSQVMLMEDLFVEGSEFILTSRLQSDPIERRFSQYRSMSGWRFLVSLREVCTSEKILRCPSLLKLGDSYWLQEETEHTEEDENVNASVRELEESEIVEASLCDRSKDVADCIAGGSLWKLQNKHKCNACSSLMIATNKNPTSEKGTYLQTLSRGGLPNPSEEFSEFVCTLFAQTEMIDKQLSGQQSVCKICCVALDNYAPNSLFACSKPIYSCRKRTIQFVVNTFYKNKQKISNDKVRKDCVKAFKSRQRTKEN